MPVITTRDAASGEVLAGPVERVTYHNGENEFCVLRAKARGHRDLVTVVDERPVTPDALSYARAHEAGLVRGQRECISQ